MLRRLIVGSDAAKSSSNRIRFGSPASKVYIIFESIPESIEL